MTVADNEPSGYRYAEDCDSNRCPCYKDGLADAGEVKTSPTPTDDQDTCVHEWSASGEWCVGCGAVPSEDKEAPRMMTGAPGFSAGPVGSQTHDWEAIEASAPVDSAPVDHITHRPGCGHWPESGDE